MVAKTWYMTNNLAGTAHQEMSETDPGTEANASPQTGWVVGTGLTNHSPLDAQSNQASGTFTATTDPDGTPTTTAGAGDCLRTTNQYSGTFAAANWTASFCFRGVTQAGTQDGRVRFRLLRSSSPTGSGAVEITAAQQQASLVTNLLTTPTQTSSLVFAPGAFTVNNEYIFIQIAWERTGAGGMTTTDVAFRIGNASGAGTRIVSADFTPTPPRTDQPNHTGILTQRRPLSSVMGLALLAAGVVTPVVIPVEEEPPAEAEYFVASTTHAYKFTRTLYYQAKIAPPPQAPVPLATAESFSVITGRASSKSLFYQARIGPPPVAAEVDNTGSFATWYVQLSRAPPRLPSETAPYSPFVPQIAPQPTADEWLQPFRRQVAVPFPIHTQPLLPYTPVEVVADVTPDQWLPRWRGPPAVLQALPGGSPFVPKEAVLENTQTPDEWLPSWRGPPSYHPAPAGGSPFVPKEAVRENTVTPDAWMVPLSRAAPIPRIVQPTQPFYGYPTEAVDNSRFEWDWSIAWQGPPRYQPPRIAAQPFVPREAVLDNTVTPDAWMPSWRGPPRPLQPLAGGVVYPPQGVVAVNTRTEWDWTLAWQGPPRHLLSLPGGAPFVPKEAVLENTQTPDKWLKPLGTVPPRYVPPKILAQPFVPREAVLENTQTPDKWLIRWQGPPRYLLELPGGSPFVAKEAVLENTVTPDQWLVRFGKAVPVPKPVPSQPVLGYPYVSQAIVVPYEQWWHQPLSRAAPRPAVHNRSYQPFVPREAVRENTQTPDKWLHRWQGPPRYTPIKVQTPPFVPREAVLDNTVTPDKWHRDLGRAAPRPPVRPTQPGWSYAPAVVDNTVTIDRWLRPLSVAVRTVRARPTQPVFVYLPVAEEVEEEERRGVTTHLRYPVRRTLFYQAKVQPYYPYQAFIPTTYEQTITVDLTVALNRVLRYSCRVETVDASTEAAEQSDVWTTQGETTDAATVTSEECVDPFQEDAVQQDAFQFCEDMWGTETEVADAWNEQQQIPQSGCCDSVAHPLVEPEPEPEPEPIGCDPDTIPVGAYAYADFENGCYWINGIEVTVNDLIVENAADWGNWSAADSIVDGVGLTSGTLDSYGTLEPALAATVQANFSIVLDCVFDYSDFSILEVYPADSPTFANLWDLFFGAGFGGFSTLELDDYLSLLAQKTGIVNAAHPTARIGFSCNHATGVVSAAMTGETLITGTAIAGHRSPPRAAFTQIAIGLQDSQAAHGNYIKNMTIYTPALSDAALAAAVA